LRGARAIKSAGLTHPFDLKLRFRRNLRQCCGAARAIGQGIRQGADPRCHDNIVADRDRQPMTNGVAAAARLESCS
jgi:hypothetical protein